MMNDKFKGIWISPNCDVYETDNIQSHRLVLKELNIEDELIQFSKEYKWNKEQLRLNYNKDVSYISMVYGYIRITSIFNQIGIEFYKDIKRDQLVKILDFIKSQDNLHEITILIDVIGENRYIKSDIFNINMDLSKFVV